jgi:hypothetical protein
MALDAWKNLVVAPVAVALKRHGFRKKGFVFSAQRPGVLLLVTLQSGTNSAQDSLQITCNLGIWVEQLERNSSPTVWESHWRMRIGFYLPEPRDYWWECMSDKSAAIAGKEIASLLETIALPALESLASPQALFALWSSGRSPGLTEMQRVSYLARLGSAQSPSVPAG